MTTTSEVSKALNEAFRAASILTGNTEVAETAVLDGITASEFGDIADDVLLVETVKCAIQRRADFQVNRRRRLHIFLWSFNGCFCLPRFLATVLY